MASYGEHGSYKSASPTYHLSSIVGSTGCAPAPRVVPGSSQCAPNWSLRSGISDVIAPAVFATACCSRST